MKWWIIGVVAVLVVVSIIAFTRDNEAALAPKPIVQKTGDTTAKTQKTTTTTITAAQLDERATNEITVSGLEFLVKASGSSGVKNVQFTNDIQSKEIQTEEIVS